MAHRRLLIITSPTQTGDTPHVAGALALRKDIDVLVLSNKGENAVDITAFYEHVAGTEAVNGGIKRAKSYEVQSDYHTIRTALTPGDEHPMEITAAIETFKVKGLTELVNHLQYLAESASHSYLALSVVGATRVIADTYHNNEYDSRAMVTKAFCSDLSAEKVKSAMPKALLDLSSHPKQPVVLLWSRYTGQNKSDAYNPAGDSDLAGQGQILKVALDLGYQPITIGHDTASKEGAHADPFHLGEFYLEEPIKSKGRAGQASYLATLMQMFSGRIVQIGQKTGGMDTAALLGIPTIYIEDEGSPTRGRMKMWEDAMLYYKCALIKQPPTFLGKAIRHLDGTCKELALKLANHSGDPLKSYVDKNGTIQLPKISDIQSGKISAIDRNISSLFLLDTVSSASGSSGDGKYDQLRSELMQLRPSRADANAKINDWPSISPNNTKNPPPPLQTDVFWKALDLAVWVKISKEWNTEEEKKKAEQDRKVSKVREIVMKMVRDHREVLEKNDWRGYNAHNGDLEKIKTALATAKLALT